MSDEHEKSIASLHASFDLLPGGAMRYTLEWEESMATLEITPQAESLLLISEEVIRARKKFPGNRFLLAALAEEFGELARAILQKEGPERVRKEAYQVACVAVRIAEEGDSSFENITDAEAKK